VALDTTKTEDYLSTYLNDLEGEDAFEFDFNKTPDGSAGQETGSKATIVGNTSMSGSASASGGTSTFTEETVHAGTTVVTVRTQTYNNNDGTTREVNSVTVTDNATGESSRSTSSVTTDADGNVIGSSVTTTTTDANGVTTTTTVEYDEKGNVINGTGGGDDGGSDDDKTVDNPDGDDCIAWGDMLPDEPWAVNDDFDLAKFDDIKDISMIFDEQAYDFL